MATMPRELIQQVMQDLLVAQETERLAAQAAPRIIDMVQYNGVWMTREDAIAELREARR